MAWQLQEAKSKFSQIVNLAMSDGPQVVTRHGKKVAVIISFDEYSALAKPKPTLLEILQKASSEGVGLEIERNKQDFGRPPLDLA